MIKERQSGKVYAIDAGVGPNGSNPAITLASQWYINDSAAPEPEPARTLAPVPAPPPARTQGGDNLGQFVERILQDDATATRPPVMAGYPARRIR